MAVTRKQTNQFPSANTRPRADAFLNIAVLDSAGVEHSMRVGIPLFESNLVERSLINKATTEGENLALKVVGSIRMNVDTTELEDITF